MPGCPTTPVGCGCRRLDGLPLAIELAAALASALGVEQIAARLDDRFALLTQGSRGAPARHQTLRAVVEGSYELLSGPERRLFDRLGVFGGRFTLDAAEEVCGQPGGLSVAELLTRLVDQSLVKVETGGAPAHRYRLLDTIRAYAVERLEQRGETGQVRARHAFASRTLVQEAADGLRSAEQGAWLERLEAEHDCAHARLRARRPHGPAHPRLVGRAVGDAGRPGRPRLPPSLSPRAT